MDNIPLVFGVWQYDLTDNEKCCYSDLEQVYEERMDSTIYLYILMRNDLASLNAGKACAQATHAANQCIFHASSKTSDAGLQVQIAEWEAQSGMGFGTCIVLSVNYREMIDAVSLAERLDVHSGICHDPSYPILDGQTLHLIPLDTCAYVFGDKVDLLPIVGKFPLMP